MTGHFRALVFAPSLLLLAQSAAPPRFEPIQADLLSTGGTLVNAAADFDHDGDVDLFEDVSAAWGIAIDARDDTCAFGDFDNDGRIDLYVNGTVTGGTSYKDSLFRNTGTRFDDVTPANLRALDADHGALWADMDDDGDVDLALTGGQLTGMHHVFRNAGGDRKAVLLRNVKPRELLTVPVK